MKNVCCLSALVCALGTTAAAQSVPREPDTARARVRFGPLSLNPSVALTNAGVDSNVYFEDESETPESDFTMTVAANTEYYLRMGRTWVLGTVREDLVWYKDFAAERSVNGNYAANWLVPLNRLAFVVGGNWIHARERPGFEIDARSERREQAANAALELRAMSKTFIGARAEKRDIEFDKDAVFLGTNLNDELTRTVTTAGFGLRHQVTPLTSISLDVAKTKDRFQFSPDRDSDSTQVTAGLSFDPFALISGSARLGYRDFTPVSNDVPGFTGLTTQIDLTYVALGATRLGFRAGRDVQYSFEIDQPYYLQTGYSVSVAQQIYGPFDVEGRYGHARLAYRLRGTTLETGRVDRVRNAGGGAGYRLGPDLRLGFNIDRQARASDVSGHNYDDWRYGVAVNYGL